MKPKYALVIILILSLSTGIGLFLFSNPNFVERSSYLQNETQTQSLGVSSYIAQGCQAPPAGCGTHYYWDSSSCSCVYSDTCSEPSSGCPTDHYWDSSFFAIAGPTLQLLALNHLVVVVELITIGTREVVLVNFIVHRKVAGLTNIGILILVNVSILVTEVEVTVTEVEVTVAEVEGVRAGIVQSQPLVAELITIGTRKVVFAGLIMMTEAENNLVKNQL